MALKRHYGRNPPRCCLFLCLFLHLTDQNSTETSKPDNCVKIWSTMCLKRTRRKKIYRLLCTKDLHDGAVNCVRWSHSGKVGRASTISFFKNLIRTSDHPLIHCLYHKKFLLSASDDRTIRIYEKTEIPISSLTDNSEVVENWRDL